MAITTLDELNAAMMPGTVYWAGPTASINFEAAGYSIDGFYWNVLPNAGTPPASGLNGTALTGHVSGQIPIPAPVGGRNIHLAELSFQQQSGFAYSVSLMDRLWHNQITAVTTTTAQSITHPGIPSRDQLGGTTGEGVMVALVNTVATTNGSAIANTTISYTNQAGTSGRTGTLQNSWPATAIINTFVPFVLQAGDTGVRSVQSITLGTSYVSGTLSLVQYREMASVGNPIPGTTVTQGAIELGLPKIFDNGVIFPVFQGSSAGNPGRIVVGTKFAQG